MKPVRYKWSTEAFWIHCLWIHQRGFSCVIDYYSFTIFWKYSFLFINLCPFNHFFSKSRITYFLLLGYRIDSHIPFHLKKFVTKLTAPASEPKDTLFMKFSLRGNNLKLLSHTNWGYFSITWVSIFQVFPRVELCI